MTDLYEGTSRTETSNEIMTGKSIDLMPGVGPIFIDTNKITTQIEDVIEC